MQTDEHTSEMVWMWTINELYRKVVLDVQVPTSALLKSLPIARSCGTPIQV